MTKKESYCEERTSYRRLKNHCVTCDGEKKEADTVVRQAVYEENRYDLYHEGGRRRKMKKTKFADREEKAPRKAANVMMNINMISLLPRAALSA